MGSPGESNPRELPKLLTTDGSRLSSDLRPFSQDFRTFSLTMGETRLLIKIDQFRHACHQTGVVVIIGAFTQQFDDLLFFYGREIIPIFLQQPQKVVFFDLYGYFHDHTIFMLFFTYLCLFFICFCFERFRFLSMQICGIFSTIQNN